jgi:hypothetical protein
MFIAALFTVVSCGNSQDALQLINGLRKCDIPQYNNNMIIKKIEKRKSSMYTCICISLYTTYIYV